MYDYHPDLVCILFVRSHPYILLHFLRNVFYYLYIYDSKNGNFVAGSPVREKTSQKVSVPLGNCVHADYMCVITTYVHTVCMQLHMNRATATAELE